MIAWPIEAALKSGAFDDVVVSTDNPEIAAVAEEYGASIPFVRPADLSGDFDGVMPAVRHGVEWMRTHGKAPAFVACIYATAPFVRAEVLRKALDMLAGSGADFVCAVTEFGYPVQRALSLDTAGFLHFAEPAYAMSRSQDLAPRYHDAGQFFIGSASAVGEYDVIVSSRCLPLPVARWEAVDIDTEEDWIFAERLFALRSA